MKKKWIAGLLLLFIIGAVLYTQRDFKKTPPTLYFNGNLITVNEAQPRASAMLVIDGQIEAIGDTSSMDMENIPNLKRTDLQGATVTRNDLNLADRGSRPARSVDLTPKSNDHALFQQSAGQLA